MYLNGEVCVYYKVKVILKSFLRCIIFHLKAGLRGAVMLNDLGCSSTVPSPHQYGSLLHTPGHVGPSPLLEGVAGAGPGAGGGAELLAVVPSPALEGATQLEALPS